MINNNKTMAGFLILFLLIFLSTYELTFKNNFSNKEKKREKLDQLLINEYSVNKAVNLDLNDFIDLINEKNEKKLQTFFKDCLNVLKSLVIDKKDINLFNKDNVLRIKNNSNYWFNNYDTIFPLEIKDNLFLKIKFNVKVGGSGGISLISQLGKNDVEWWLSLNDIYLGIDNFDKNYYLSVQVKNNSKECILCYKLPLKNEENYHEFYFVVDKENNWLYALNNKFNDNVNINEDFYLKRVVNGYKIKLKDNFYIKNKVYLGIAIGPKSEVNIKEFSLVVK